jgi:hypothetical protein
MLANFHHFIINYHRTTHFVSTHDCKNPENDIIMKRKINQ